MSRQLKFRTWLGKRFWFFDLSTGFNNENKDVCSDPEQFTGLCDIKGDPIFEGDIVKATATNNDHHQLGATEICQIYESMGRFCIAPRFYKIGLTVYDCSLTSDIEIIGNIHENPELLK